MFIFGFNKGMYDKLCFKCHILFQRRYGVANGSRDMNGQQNQIEAVDAHKKQTEMDTKVELDTIDIANASIPASQDEELP